MNKITYWMRKLGMLRTSSYKVSGDAEKLNKVQASGGGMIQSPKEINIKYKGQNTGQSNNNNASDDTLSNNDKKGSGNKVLFWIFLVIGVSLCILILLMDFSVWFMLAIVAWAWFLHNIWSKTGAITLVIAKTIAIGILLSVLSIIFILIAAPSDEEEQKNNNVGQNNSQVVEKTKNEDVKNVTKETLSIDKISQFFVELEKETGVAFGQVEDVSGIVWTNGGAGLGLQKAKQIKTDEASSKEWKLIKQYFEDNNGTHGTIGMVFVGENNQDGYYFQNGEFNMLMCVLTDTKKDITISCGWGPGGGK